MAIKYSKSFRCRQCKRTFKDGYDYGKHMVHFHKLVPKYTRTGKVSWVKK